MYNLHYLLGYPPIYLICYANINIPYLTYFVISYSHILIYPLIFLSYPLPIQPPPHCHHSGSVDHLFKENIAFSLCIPLHQEPYWRQSLLTFAHAN